MVRFAADVDSPPAKEAMPKISPATSEAMKPLSVISTKVPERRASPSPSAKRNARRRANAKIRRLIEAEGRQRTQTQKKTITRCSIEVIMLVSIALSLAYYGLKDISFSSPCSTQFDPAFVRGLSLKLSNSVFRQDVAIQNISALLESHKGLTTMSFVGGTGVGKSLVAKLMSNYWGPAQAHAYNWLQTYETTHLDHYMALQELILGLANCQPQLVIIDNLSWEHKPFIEDATRWLKTNSRLREKNLVVVFVFNWSAYAEDPEAHEHDETSVGELQKTNLVLFSAFQETDAVAYLRERGHGVLEGLANEPEYVQLLVESANVRQHGLKRLANKLQD